MISSIGTWGWNSIISSRPRSRSSQKHWGQWRRRPSVSKCGNIEKPGNSRNQRWNKKTKAFSSLHHKKFWWQRIPRIGCLGELVAALSSMGAAERLDAIQQRVKRLADDVVGDELAGDDPLLEFGVLTFGVVSRSLAIKQTCIKNVHCGEVWNGFFVRSGVQKQAATRASTSAV